MTNVTFALGVAFIDPSVKQNCVSFHALFHECGSLSARDFGFQRLESDFVRQSCSFSPRIFAV